MRQLVLSKNDFDDDNKYNGNEDLSAFDGSIRISAKLGRVVFDSLKASLGITVEAGTWVKSVRSIEAGEGIEAEGGIEAEEGIEAGLGIEARLGIKAGLGIEAGWGIEAGSL